VGARHAEDRAARRGYAGLRLSAAPVFPPPNRRPPAGGPESLGRRAWSWNSSLSCAVPRSFHPQILRKSPNSKDWPWQKLAELGTLDRGVSKLRPRNAPESLGGPQPQAGLEGSLSNASSGPIAGESLMGVLVALLITSGVPPK
jgi:hypothetical protein